VYSHRLTIDLSLGLPAAEGCCVVQIAFTLLFDLIKVKEIGFLFLIVKRVSETGIRMV
jgi:hypothetical protein